MKVMMLILETPEDFALRGAETPAAAEYWNAWGAFSETFNDKTIGGNVLAPVDQAATIRLRGGERQIQDGPYADSKEALGGYMLLEVESMEEAIEIASKCPAAATGALELRPVVPMNPEG